MHAIRLVVEHFGHFVLREAMIRSNSGSDRAAVEFLFNCGQNSAVAGYCRGRWEDAEDEREARVKVVLGKKKYCLFFVTVHFRILILNSFLERMLILKLTVLIDFVSSILFDKS